MKTFAALLRDTRHAALFVAGCVVALAANAQSQVTLTGTSGPALTGTESLTIGTANQSTNMGQFTINTSAGNYAVYCLDPLRFITAQNYYTISLDNFFQNTTGYAGANVGQTSYQKEFTDTTYTSKSLSSATVWGLASQANANTVLANLKTLYQHAYTDSLIDTYHSQAFQYAVWEVLLDTSGSYNTSANNLKTNAGVNTTFASIATGYLSALNTPANWATIGLSGITNYTFNAFVPAGAGGQIVLNVQKVPEPAALSLAAIALLGLGISRRRRAQA